MIRKIIQRVNEWLEDRLRSIVRPLSPDARVIVIVTMLIVFSGLSIYMTVSSIYNLGKDKGQELQIEQIETLKLQPEQLRDSINNQNKFYNGTGEFFAMRKCCRRFLSIIYMPHFSFYYKGFFSI